MVLGEYIIIKTILLAVTATLLLSTTAQAQISEIRVGVSEFDEDTTGINWGAGDGRENSLGINAEVIFNPLLGNRNKLALHPYIGGMVNLEGDTSYIAAGVMLRKDFGPKFYGDIGIGLALHDGRVQLSDLPRRERFEASHSGISFGYDVLFRPAISLGYRFDDSWAAEIFMDHLSNGNVLNGDRRINEGVDNLGLRIAKRF